MTMNNRLNLSSIVRVLLNFILLIRWNPLDSELDFHDSWLHYIRELLSFTSNI